MATLRWYVVVLSNLGTWEKVMGGYCGSWEDANVLAWWFTMEYPGRVFDCIEVHA